MLLGVQDPSVGQQSSPILDLMKRQKMDRLQEEQMEQQQRQFALDIAKGILGAGQGGAQAAAALAAL
jgi:hypothetical protein